MTTRYNSTYNPCDTAIFINAFYIRVFIITYYNDCFDSEITKTVYFRNYQKLTAWGEALLEKLTFENSSLLGYAAVLIVTGVMAYFAASIFRV